MTIADLLTAAFKRIQVVQSNAVPTPEDMADGFLRFKAMLGSWRLQRLTIPFIQAISAPLIPNKQIYNVGYGADLACTRPTQLAALRWMLRDANVTPPAETPLDVMTEEEAFAIPQKGMTGLRPQAVFYQPAGGVPPPTTNGQVTVFPIPTGANLSLVLYAPIGIDNPAATSSTLLVPEGYELALTDNLARVLWPEWRENVPIDPELRASAVDGLAWIKTNNVRMTDLSNAASWLFPGGGTSYDITSDTGG